jgi:hypothetical protein
MIFYMIEITAEKVKGKACIYGSALPALALHMGGVYRRKG